MNLNNCSMTYTPLYKRPPNKFLSYVIEEHDLYNERVAIYLDKNGKECRMTAQIIWKHEPFTEEWYEDSEV